MKDKRKESVCTTYNNAVVVRQHNKRLVIAKTISGTNIIFVKVLEKNETLKMIPTPMIIKNKVFISELAFSDDGLETLYEALGQYLNLDKRKIE